jgi:hypothetical protein
MFNAKENEPGKKRNIYGTLLMLVFAALLAIAGRLYAAHDANQQLAAQTPQLAAKTLSLDLRLFAQKKNRFPVDWVELEDVLWRPRRNQGREESPRVSILSNGPRLYLRDNYLYLYTFANDKTCTFWAVPRGPLRESSQTVFVLVTPQTLESWRGPALADEAVSKIPQGGLPTFEQMALLAMSKEQTQPPRKNWLSSLWPF